MNYFLNILKAKIEIRLRNLDKLGMIENLPSSFY